MSVTSVRGSDTECGQRELVMSVTSTIGSDTKDGLVGQPMDAG